MADPARMPSEVAQRIYDLLQDEKDALITSDGQVFYGDQNRIGVTPTVCVEAGSTSRTLQGVGGNGRTENMHSCYIIIYYAKVDTNQATKLESEQVAEGIVRYLDTNVLLDRNGDGGIVIHGFVTTIDPGYSFRDQGKSLYQTVRLTWMGKTKTILGA